MAEIDWRQRLEDGGDPGNHVRHDSLVDPNVAALAKASLEDDSFLLSVPGDVRNLIYQSVLFEPDGVHLHFGCAGNTAVVEAVTALSAACSRTRSESKDLAYLLNVFHFHLPMLAEQQQQQQQQSRTNGTDTTIADAATATSSLSTSSLPRPPLSNHQTSRTPNLTPASEATSAATATSLRRISQTFYELATTSAKLRTASAHLERAVARLPRALRRVHVHLGSQTQTVAFLPAFHAGWDTVVPSVLALRQSSGVASVRVRFVLRLSLRMLLACDFEAKSSLAEALAEVDAGVRVDGAADGEGDEWRGGGSEEWEATLSEMTAVNEVRAKLAQTLWSAKDVGHWSGR